jgi:hypothetical protein
MTERRWKCQPVRRRLASMSEEEQPARKPTRAEAERHLRQNQSIETAGGYLITPEELTEPYKEEWEKAMKEALDEMERKGEIEG